MKAMISIFFKMLYSQIEYSFSSSQQRKYQVHYFSVASHSLLCLDCSVSQLVYVAMHTMCMLADRVFRINISCGWHNTIGMCFHLKCKWVYFVCVHNMRVYISAWIPSLPAQVGVANKIQHKKTIAIHSIFMLGVCNFLLFHFFYISGAIDRLLDLNFPCILVCCNLACRWGIADCILVASEVQTCLFVSHLIIFAYVYFRNAMRLGGAIATRAIHETHAIRNSIQYYASPLMQVSLHSLGLGHPPSVPPYIHEQCGEHAA